MLWSYFGSTSNNSAYLYEYTWQQITAAMLLALSFKHSIDQDVGQRMVKQNAVFLTVEAWCQIYSLKNEKQKLATARDHLIQLLNLILKNKP